MGKKFLLKGISILAAVVLFIAIATPIVQLKNGNSDKYQKSLYSDDEDVMDADVIFLGGSHAYNGFDPNVLWEDYGIKSYNYSNSGQAIYLSYYLFKEILKNHQPKILVLDLYYIGVTSEYFAESSYLRNVIDNMKWSQNKLDFIMNCVPSEERLAWIFTFFKYHSRITDLTITDFTNPINYDNDFWLGSGYQWESNDIVFEDFTKTSEVGTIPEKSLYYLNAIIDLAQTNNISLVFTSLPHDYINAARPDTWVDNEYAMFNAVKILAAKENIPFLQFIDGITDEIGFDSTTDMFNTGHMNINGAIKVSKYIGSFLKSHYDLPDYSGNDNSLWDSYTVLYHKYVDANT